MLVKNLPLGQIIWKIPFRVFLDAISAWKSLIQGNGAYFLAIIKAHLAFIKWLITKKEKRKFFKKKKGMLKGWFKGSIVWEHFVLHKRNFQEIVENKR